MAAVSGAGLVEGIGTSADVVYEKRAAGLSVEESRAEYDALCRVWEHSRAAAAQAALDRRAIADRIALRRRLAGHR